MYVYIHTWTICLRSVAHTDRADKNVILKHQANHQEDKVKQEHGETKPLTYLPLTGCNGDDEKEEHDKEQHDGAEEAIAADGDWNQTADE